MTWFFVCCGGVCWSGGVLLVWRGPFGSGLARFGIRSLTRRLVRRRGGGLGGGRCLDSPSPTYTRRILPQVAPHSRCFWSANHGRLLAVRRPVIRSGLLSRQFCSFFGIFRSWGISWVRLSRCGWLLGPGCCWFSWRTISTLCLRWGPGCGSLGSLHPKWCPWLIATLPLQCGSLPR